MIDREAIKHSVEEDYIGFKPSYGNMGPVHLAHGIFMGISEKSWNTNRFFEFIRPFNAKGVTEVGHDNASVYKYLSSKEVDAIDIREISEDDLLIFRTLANKIACMDKGAYAKSMQSYSVVNEHYLGNDTIGIEIGEFIAYAIKKLSPMLYSKVKIWLADSEDLLSMIFVPVESNIQKEYKPSINLDEKLNLFLNRNVKNGTADRLTNAMKNLFDTLSYHMENTNNYLANMRELVLVSSFLIIRYMACLEDIYIKESYEDMIPLLLDFTDDSNGAVSLASKLNYTMICNSVSRFYARKYGEKIFEDNEVGDILQLSVPATKQLDLAKSLWDYCLEELNEKKYELPKEELYDLIGFALYGIIQIDTSANPNSCMRKIGTESGIFYPASPNPPIKRMCLKQDTFEAIIKANVNPEETLTVDDLQDKLWINLGIVIGGREIDEQRLNKAGISGIDTDSLKENQKLFVEKLESLDFARLLADGILQVRLGDRK